MEIKISDIERLPEAAAQFIESMAPGKVYAFFAPMGAGKTTFISEVCRQLGSDGEANSPTFSIVNEYETSKWGKIYHLDCYRLDDEEAGRDIGVEEYFYSGATSFVEWPEKIEGLLPDDVVTIEIAVSDSGERTLRIS